MREKARVIRIIVDTFRQEKLLTMLKPIVDESELLKLKKELEGISYEAVLGYENLLKNSNLYFYELASKREDEKDMFIDRIIEICKVEDTVDNVIEKSGVYDKLREKLENKSYEEVKGLLEIYRRRKKEAYDVVMDSCMSRKLKLV